MANRKPRMGRMTQRESRWVEMIIESRLVDQEYFYAKEVVSLIFDSRRKDGDGKLNNIPNVHRVNNVLKKCKKFDCSKDRFNSNKWSLKEGEE